MNYLLRSLRPSFWGSCLVLLMVGGVSAACVRLKVSESLFGFPCNLGLGLNVLCGLALAAGGITVASTIAILGLEAWRALIRPSLVVGFLGYFVAVLGFLANASVAQHLASHMKCSTQSIENAVSAGLAFFALLLLLEFGPDFSAWLRSHEVATRALILPVMLLVLVLTVLYQSILVDTIQASAGGLSPLWSSPQMPFLFFISAVCAVLASLIFVSWHVSIYSGDSLSPESLAKIGKALAALLFFLVAARFIDVLARELPIVALKSDAASLLFGLEVALFFIPMWILGTARDALPPRTIYYSAIMVLAGVITNRLNTCITSAEAATGVKYLPNWSEFLLACSIIAVAIAAFSAGKRKFCMFPPA